MTTRTTRRQTRRTTERPAWAIAAEDERTRFNAAIANGARVILTTFSGRYIVKYVTAQWWYVTYTEGGSATSDLNQQSWCGCNDGTWTDLMRQARVERNPLWAA